MKSGFYKDLDTNFEQACEMSEKEFEHAELIEMLKSGNIPEKQIAALRLKKLESKSEAQILLNNLTGCDGKIREAVSLRINNFLREKPEYAEYFSDSNAAETFANGTIDINANICRLVVDSIFILKKNKEFSEIYLSKIIKFIDDTFEELDKFIFRDKKYVINKQLFKLYWCLEALKLFVSELDKENLYRILTRISCEREYTIREKAAQILILTKEELFKDLKEQLKNDDNYYVRTVFKS